MRSPVALLRRDEQLAQERARHLAGGHRVPAEARERPRGLARERGLEGRHEGRVHGLAVALEGRTPDEGATAEEHPARDRRPAPQPVEEARLLEQVHRRGHHARRLERVVPLGVAADVGQLDELRLARRLVPAGDPGVRGAEVERPPGHGGPTLAQCRPVIPRTPARRVPRNPQSRRIPRRPARRGSSDDETALALGRTMSRFERQDLTRFEGGCHAPCSTLCDPRRGVHHDSARDPGRRRPTCGSSCARAGPSSPRRR